MVDKSKNADNIRLNDENCIGITMVIGLWISVDKQGTYPQ